MNPARAPVLAATALAFLPLSAAAEVLDVGPEKPFARIEEAAKKAAPDDVIQIHPLPDGKPYTKPVLLVRTPRLTFRGMKTPDGRRVCLDGEGFDYSGSGPVPRAIFQFDPGADGCVVEGLELRNARNGSANGAGVRVNQASDVAVRDCDIHHNDMGMMSNGDVAKQTCRNLRVESCVIHHNGSESRAGYNHNLYLGGTSVILRACEVFASTTGHNVKSRAHYNRIEYCYIHDSANREFDLVDAAGNTDVPESHAVLLGNVIVKASPCKGNRSVIHFGQDGGKDHQGTIHLVHNTIVTPYLSPVLELSAPGTGASLHNNIVWDAGSGQKGQVLAAVRTGAGLEKAGGAGNWLAGDFGLPVGGLKAGENIAGAGAGAPPFVDPAKGNYCLRPGEAGRLVQAGVPSERIKLPAAPGETEPQSLLKLSQYKAPLQAEPREDAAHPAVGACGTSK
jgi:hypothetical protein